MSEGRDTTNFPVVRYHGALGCAPCAMEQISDWTAYPPADECTTPLCGEPVFRLVAFVTPEGVCPTSMCRGCYTKFADHMSGVRLTVHTCEKGQ